MCNNEEKAWRSVCVDRRTYTLLDQYMLSCMEDSAHDREHIYRVLYHAVIIAKTEENVNYDVLIAACLLHDIGRKEQYERPELCHAAVGGEKAYRFLKENGFDENFALHVQQCIQSHRYRKNNIPQSVEAKILFDADKLDAVGAMGIARTLLYQGIVGDPLYTCLQDGSISDGAGTEKPSFFREYKYKLEKLYDRFYTKKAAEIANQRRSAAVSFYNSLLDEVQSTYGYGLAELNERIGE